jgi:hypothetical protein
VPERSSYDYAVVRVVPDLERAEFFNAGVILFAKTARALLTRVWLDEARLAQLTADPDAELVRAHLGSLERIATGGEDAGTIGALSASQRFHWLVSPRSTMIQTSPVHSGLCSDPSAELDRLFERLVQPVITDGEASDP